MSSIQHQQRLLAEASLGLFSATYEEILKSKGLKHGPVSGKELLEMMNEAIFGDGDVLAPQKPNSETAPEQATWEEQRNQRFRCDLLSLIRKRKVPRARRRSDLARRIQKRRSCGLLFLGCEFISDRKNPRAI